MDQLYNKNKNKKTRKAKTK